LSLCVGWLVSGLAPKHDQPVTDGGENARRKSEKRLNSWKEIASFLQKDVRTVQRWEKNERLPVHRKPHDKLSSVYAYESELEAWWNQGSHPLPSTNSFSQMGKSASGRIGLAVLPLRNLSDDPAQEYFSDGLTEELIGQLARIDPDHLGIIARASAMKYKQSSKGISQIARELGVTYLLEGSVRRDGDRVRISAALIRASDQTNLWTDVYDHDLRDVLKLQAEVAEAVAKQIALKVSSGERARLARSGQVDPEAFSAYLRGRYLWNRRAPDALEKAIHCFQESIARAPDYAPAHAGLADCYVVLASAHVGALPPIEGMPRAIAAAEKALQLDPELADAHASLGNARFRYDFDWSAAERSLKRALELNPAYAPALQWHSSLLQTIDRIEESLVELRHALDVDPFSLIIRSSVAATLYLERRYEQVIEESRRILELDPTFVLVYFNLGRAYTQMKRHREAVAELKKARELSGDSPAMTMQLGYAYAMAGKVAEAKKMLAALARIARKRYVPSFYWVAIHTGLGDIPKALEYLRKARDERCDYLVHLSKEPAADPIRNTPEFAQLVPRPELI
jgi:TolB-like protein/Flp pilus assembly protein TadD